MDDRAECHRRERLAGGTPRDARARDRPSARRAHRYHRLMTVTALVDYNQHPGVTYVPIHDAPPSRTGFVHRSTGTTPAGIAFIEHATQNLRPPDPATDP